MAETNCAKWRGKSVPVWLREKGKFFWLEQIHQYEVGEMGHRARTFTLIDKALVAAIMGILFIVQTYTELSFVWVNCGGAQRKLGEDFTAQPARHTPEVEPQSDAGGLLVLLTVKVNGRGSGSTNA